jgi:Na+/H+ antiporter NhaD/arsenite permease-like protein
MMVGSLEANGLFEKLGHILIDLTAGNLMMTALAILWFSALFSAFLDNIPMVISMIPVIQTIIPAFAAQMGLDPAGEETRLLISEPLYWSLALGACLGGNGTIIGASANVVVTQIARRNFYPFSFFHFMKYGFPIMILSVALSSIYIVLRYFL